MSETLHAVIRGLTLTGFGKRPALIPDHQLLALTGIGPCGAMICCSRTKPISGKEECLFTSMHTIQVLTVEYLSQRCCSCMSAKVGMSFCGEE
jgi:hypothetical protein